MISSGCTGVDSSSSIDPFSHSRATASAVSSTARIAMTTTARPGITNQRLLSSELNRKRVLKFTGSGGSKPAMRRPAIVWIDPM